MQDPNYHVQTCGAELVFNLDEIGISDWEDHKMKKIAAPPRGVVKWHIMEYLEM
jgi:hypothetical protein